MIRADHDVVPADAAEARQHGRVLHVDAAFFDVVRHRASPHAQRVLDPVGKPLNGLDEAPVTEGLAGGARPVKFRLGLSGATRR